MYNKRQCPAICGSLPACKICIFSTEESSPLESEDEDVGVTESQDDSENVLQRRASPPLAENKSNNTRSKADLVSMYHQFFQEMNCTKVRFTCGQNPEMRNIET